MSSQSTQASRPGSSSQPGQATQPGHNFQASPLRLGSLVIDTPVILAPMAGFTNAPFRRLCREFAASTGFDPGLYVAEMVTSRALVERNAESLRIVTFDADEQPRSAQVYGVDPATVGQAVRIIAGEGRADHIDLNFGCPVPKVTRKGGGGALPWKTDLFAGIVRSAVQAAQPYGLPVTVKTRVGIDDQHVTYLDAGRIAEAEGAAAICLHARTVEQRYSGQARWEHIARLKDAVSIAVTGNGDIFDADDAVAMMQQTGCDGVVIGRGCQGRPWLFADLAAAMHGQRVRVRPSLAQVADIIYRHAQLMAQFYGAQVEGARPPRASRCVGLGVGAGKNSAGEARAEENSAGENRAVREIRKHIAFYLKGYPVGGVARHALATVGSMPQLRAYLDALGDAPYPADADGQRGRAGSPKRPHLPEGWLDSRDLPASWTGGVEALEDDISGG